MKSRLKQYFVEDKDGKSLPVQASRVEVTPSGVLCLYVPNPVHSGQEKEVLAWAFASFDWVRVRLSSVAPLTPQEE